MSSLSRKTLSLFFTEQNLANFILLIATYFFGPYIGIIKTSDQILTAGAVLLAAPFIVKSTKFLLKKASENEYIADKYASLLSAAVSGGGALFILMSNANLLPDVAVNAISSLIKSGASMTGLWWEKAVTTIQYCSKLYGIDLTMESIQYLYTFVKQYVSDFIIQNGTNILYVKEIVSNATAPRVEFIYRPRAIFASFIYAFEKVGNIFDSKAILDAYSSYLSSMTETIYNNIDIASIWLNENVPSIVKLFAAARTWLVTAAGDVYGYLEPILGSAAATNVAYITGFVVSSMGAAWLAKTIYSLSGAVETKQPDACFENFAQICQQLVGVTIESYPIIRNKSANYTTVNSVISRAIVNINGLVKCGTFANQIVKILNEFKQVLKVQNVKMEFSSDEMYKYIIENYRKFLSKAIDLISSQQNILIQSQADDDRKVAINEIARIVVLEFSEQNILLKNPSKIKEERKPVDVALIALQAASESTDNQIPFNMFF
jgi:hypothetical protein